MKNLGLRIIGLLLFLLAIIGLVATIALSISGGANDYTNINKLNNLKDYSGLFKLSGFIIATIFIQLMIFSISGIETFIKMKFNRHFGKTIILQYGLLIVSIYYNNKFFGANSIIKLLLCILLDLSVIKLVSLSIDLISLNYSFNSFTNKQETNNIFKMFIDNLFYEKVARIKNTYEKNNNLSSKIESSKEIKTEIREEVLPKSKLKKVIKPSNNEPSINNLINFESSKKVNLAKNEAKNFKNLNLANENYNKFFEYIIKNNEDGNIEGYKKIAEKLNISESKAKTIFKKLIENGIICVEGKKTKLTKLEGKTNEK
jgi:hypothetical protein